MFPEPVTAIGFALSCVSFLLNSLPNLEQKRRQIVRCREFLQNFERQLRNTQLKYEAWRGVWGDLSDEQYVQAWGARDVFRVQQWSVDIDIYLRRIERVIRGPQEAQLHRVLNDISRSTAQARPRVDMPTNTDLEWWDMHVRQINQNRPNLVVSNNIREAGIPYRIAFAFFHNDLLKTDLDSLAKTVDELDKFTTHAYWRLRLPYMQSRSNTLTRTEVRNSLRWQDSIARLSSFAKILHEAQLNKNQQVDLPRRRLWTLELRLPDATGNSGDLNIAGRINIDFCLVDHISDPPSDLKRARILYTPGELTAPNTRFEERVIDILNRLYASISDDDWPVRYQSSDEGFQSLKSAGRRSVPLRRLFEQDVLRDEQVLRASLIDRITLAVGLVNWVLLLWLTKWTSLPCCCQIRLYELPDGKMSFTLAGENHSCDLAGRRERKLVSLGVTLAEILLGTPMRALPPPDQAPNILGVRYSLSAPWIIQKWRPGLLNIGSGYWDTVQVSEVLQEIKLKMDTVGRCDSLIDAIGYCLINPPSSPDPEFPVEALVECATNVLIPFRKYLEMLSEHKKSFALKEWFISALQPGKWPPENAFESRHTALQLQNLAMPGTFPGLTREEYVT